MIAASARRGESRNRKFVTEPIDPCLRRYDHNYYYYFYLSGQFTVDDVPIICAMIGSLMDLVSLILSRS